MLGGWILKLLSYGKSLKEMTRLFLLSFEKNERRSKTLDVYDKHISDYEKLIAKSLKTQT